MMDGTLDGRIAMDPVERARRDLERVTETIRRSEEALRRATAERERIKAFLEMYDRYATGDEKAPAGASRRSGTPKKAIVKKAADDLIASAGAPMFIGPLFKQIKARGIDIGGKNEQGRLANILSASEGFIFLPKFGWWIKRLPFPEHLLTPEIKEMLAMLKQKEVT